MCASIKKKDKSLINIYDIKTLFTKEPTKAKVQELKWKSTINRQSLPVELPKLHTQNIMEVKKNNRRKTESDIDLNVDSYNINPLEKEEIEYSRNKKHKKKCTKSNCKLFNNDKKVMRISNKEILHDRNSEAKTSKDTLIKHREYKHSKHKSKETSFQNNLKPSLSKKNIQALSDSDVEANVKTSGRSITKIKLFTKVKNSVNTSDSSYNENKVSQSVSKIKLKSKKYDKIENEISISENSMQIVHMEETSPEKVKKKIMKNAFSVMMKARNNVIGSNSDGEEKSEDTDLSLEENIKIKSKLKERKTLLEHWANEKGAKKRKLKEEAREDYVIKTLNRRAKKFKAMFENSQEKILEIVEPTEETHSSNKLSHRRSQRSIKKLEMNKSNKMKKDEEPSVNIYLNKNSDISCSDSKNSTEGDRNESDSFVPEIQINLDHKSYKSKSLRSRKNKINQTESNEEIFNAIAISDTDCYFKQESAPKRVIKSSKQRLKLAPVFVKKSVPKYDQQIIEAKKNFLQSGLPDQCIKIIEKQKLQDNYEYTLFPLISHVLQSEQVEYISNKDDKVWANWVLRTDSDQIWNPVFNKKLTLGSFTNCHCSIDIQKPISNPAVKKLNTKVLLKEFKKINPKFPVNAIYHNFKTRFDCKLENEPLNMLWTEKYKPISSRDIIGNTKSVTELKEWLCNWVVNRKEKLIRLESDSDFIDSEADSRDSFSSKVNTCVLVGPNGSGKTSAVYAVANDLNINVLEINASSQRNGKRILNDIQEATQSRHFRENLNNCVQLKRCNNTKSSVILIEDIDIVFPTIDDGFLGAINNIIMSGKRPVILTSSDKYSTITQKYISQNKTLNFHLVSSTLTIPWLQLVSIMEEVWPNEKQITDLYNLNNMDLRKTLLDLQFLILSGKTNYDKTTNDENSKITNLSLSNFYSNYNLVSSYPLNLNNLYWILLNELPKSKFEVEETERNKKLEQKQINTISQLFDNLALVDTAYVKNELGCTLNPAACLWKSEFSQLSNSLSMNSNMDMYTNSIKIMNDWTHYLISRRSKWFNIRNNYDWKTSCMEKIRLKKQKQEVNSKLLDGIPLSSYLGPRNLGLDYFAFLRAMNRTEAERLLVNIKRGNRFCNYLKNLNIHCNKAQNELILSSLSF